MKTRIIVDSTVDLSAELKERLSIVPLTVHFGDEEYLDGVTIDHKTFYEKLIESDQLPTTSQATPDSFIKEFEKVKESGDSAVVITISSKLSGTYQSATIAAEDYENIYIVDSGSAAIGSGILAERALELADSGMEARDIAETLNKEKEKTVIIALLDTLEYLKKADEFPKPSPLQVRCLISNLLSLLKTEKLLF
ncbi:MAG: DegV family protein [Acutalibacteraceae bacterium]|nr:DegV family protein [Acutalibacteraceae bacterium]